MLSAPVIYFIQPNAPVQGVFTVIAEFPETHGTHFSLRLPFWRPGRYTSGNFLKNITRIAFFQLDALNQETPIQAAFTQDLGWKVKIPAGSRLRVKYHIRAHELNAGSSYCEPDFVQINPVNLCMISMQHLQHPHRMELQHCQDFQYAGAAPFHAGILECPDFDSLADQPFWLGKNFDIYRFKAENMPFELIIHGSRIVPDEQFISDLQKICATQIRAFGGFPVPVFRFLLKAVQNARHHGVEHLHSTICLLGPDVQLFQEKRDELLALLSHELYHVWNIKTIRPQGMQPYSWTGPVPCAETFLAEGITTYMGELMRAKAGQISPEQLVLKIAHWWKNHCLSPGNECMSILRAGYETWVDGYDPESPYRRRSIYNEGALLALCLDLFLLEESCGAFSLSDFMRMVYKDPEKHSYTWENWKLLIESQGFTQTANWFEKAVYCEGYYHEFLENACEVAGLIVEWTEQPESWALQTGIYWGRNKVIQYVSPESPGALAGCMAGDMAADWDPEQLRPDLLPLKFGCLRNGILHHFEIHEFQSGKLPEIKIPHLGIHPLFQRWVNG